MALALRPTTDIRATPFELDLHGPFSIAGTTFDQPAAVARQLDSLIGVGIVAARTTDLDGLELELMTGDIVSAGPASWSLEAPDGRRWDQQPGGGVALWGMDTGRAASIRPPPSTTP